MSFADQNITAPERLETAEFILRPITVADNDLDYAAVVETREFLRQWDQSDYPEDGFSLEDNRADMIKMQDRHARGESFAYTVMDPAETQCLGCVYVFSPQIGWFADAKIQALGDAPWTSRDAMIYFWALASRLDDGLDRRIIDAVVSWFETDWPLNNPVVVASSTFTQQVAMLDQAGLERGFDIRQPEDPEPFFGYV